MKKLFLLLLLFIVTCGSSESEISGAEIQAQIDETLEDTTTTVEDNKIESEENNLNKANCYEWLEVPIILVVSKVLKFLC